MRICPDCQNPLEDQAVFCDNCGLRLSNDAVGSTSASESEKSQFGSETPRLDEAVFPRSESQPPISNSPAGVCSSCGYSNVPGEMFCQNCGVQLAPVVSVPPPPPTPISVPASIDEDAAPPPPEIQGVCTNCGYKNDPTEAYCQNCGIALVQQVAAQQSEPQLNASTGEISPAPETGPILDAAEDLKIPGFKGKLIVRMTGDEIMLPMGQTEATLGRSDPVRGIFPDIDLTPHGGESGGVSRMHARITLSESKVFVEDLNSTNFTFLNRDKLTAGETYPLVHGDELRLGLLVLDYEEV